MPERSRRPKRPRDSNELAKAIVDIATGVEDNVAVATTAEDKDPAAVSLGRRGGLKGGKARAAKLSPQERSNIARKAAKARWSTKNN